MVECLESRLLLTISDPSTQGDTTTEALSPTFIEDFGNGAVIIRTRTEATPANILVGDGIRPDLQLNGSGLQFNLIAAGGMSQQAIDGFQAAADLWSTILRDDILVTININFTAIYNGAVGTTNFTTQENSLSAFKTALTADAQSLSDQTAVANLPVGSALTLYTSDPTTGVAEIDNNGSANNRVLDVTTATAKAVGLRAANDAASDGSISFSTLITFDFDRSDGITANAIDFVGVAAHEIGHLLGFTSGADVVDYCSGNGPEPQELDIYRVVQPLDLFRYSAASEAAGASIDIRADTATKYFSIDGGATQLTTYSTGRYNGNGLQCSHWGNNPNIGIMNPTVVDGQFLFINDLDIQAFDVIGWNIAGSSSTSPPVVSSLSPTDNSTNVPVTSNLAITFNEYVEKDSGDILIRNSSDNSVVQRIPVTSNAVTVSGAVVTINPTDLAGNTDYYVEVPATAFNDFSNNDFAGIGSPTAWNFTTREISSFDHGDAPAPYPTTIAENGAQHDTSGPRLGTTRDSEANGTHSAAANADGADEDGVTFGTIKVGALGATATVYVQGGSAKLDAWIDFNGDGNWGGPGEQIASSMAVVNGNNTISFDVPSGAIGGTTFARFRLSTAGNLGPEGTAADGEVEDYAVTITPPTVASGVFGGQNTVTTGANGASSVTAADVDGDGDLDVLSASAYDDKIAWYENNGSEVFTAHTISTAADGAISVTAADVDGDGDLDVLSALANHAKIAWYENKNASVIAAFDAAVTYVENAAALILDADATVTNPNSSSNFNTGTLTVALTANGQTADRLEIRHQGTGAGQIGVSGANVSFAGTTIGTFVGGTGTTALVVTLNPSATPAAVQALLRDITFRTITEVPVTAARTVRVTLTDGTGLTSNQPTKTINITAVNDAPTITGFDTLVTYVENGAAMLIDSDVTPVTVTDPDSTNFATGTMTVSLSPLAATDVLAIRNQGVAAGQIGLSGANVTFGGTVIGAFTGGTNTVSLVITLNTNATPAAVQALARNLTFRSTSENPSTAQRTAKIVLTDGDGGTRTVTKKINVTVVNDAPVLASTTTTIAYTENGLAKALNPLITVVDPDHATLPSATVRITNFVAGQDVLGFVPVVATMGNIVASSNVNGLLTLTSAGATATTLQWQAALRAVTYLNTSDNPTTTTRNVQFATTDGTIASNTFASTITVAAVADAPTIANFTPNITFTEGGAALLIDTDVTVSDPDTADTGGGILKVYTNVVDAADRLAIRNQGTGAGLIGVSGANVTFGGVVIGTFSGGVSTTPLTITLNASARYASVQALLRNVTFQNTSATPVVTPRTLRVSYHNGLERIVSKTLTVVATISQPVVNGGLPTEQPAATNPLTAGTNSPTTKRRRAALAPDSNAPVALDTASAAQRRANRRRGV